MASSRSARVQRLLPFLVFGMFFNSARAPAQNPTRDNYYDFLPSRPSITAQTPASASLALYGDSLEPGYRDELPRDGVDDARAARLLEIAERFSPILRRNTRSVPREFESELGGEVVIELDSWMEGRRIASRRISLGPPLEPLAGSATAGLPAVPRTAPDDSALAVLLRAAHPRRVHEHIAQPRASVDSILFIDIPGDEQVSWRRQHSSDWGRGSMIYAHPFIDEGVDGSRDRRFRFLVQYWFYYPYNDGANNHEGDWEHITVAVTSASRARDGSTSPNQPGLLTRDEIAAIIGSRDPLPVDSLTLQSVAYYFHNNVMLIDYAEIAAGGTLWRRASANDGSIHIWEDTGYMDDAIRRRIALADGRLATHPIGYIGGNSKGTDELLQLAPRFFSSYNRDSHGTYPFPGVWREVGPLDATEKIYGDVVPELHERWDEPGRPWYDLVDDDRYLVYRAKDIVLLPDWERLERLVLEDAGVRRRWAWFILPVHMGFPATASPGAGALKRVDMGNVAPMSPAYNTAWNRTGVTAVYPLYQPTVLRVAAAPISPWAGMQSGWGFLNIPIVVAGLMPGANVAISQLLPWITGAMHVMGAPPAKTFYTGDLPSRFTSFGTGAFHQFGGSDFARLLPGSSNAAVQAALEEHADEGAVIGRRSRAPEWGSRAWFNLYYGPRLSIENSFAYSSARVSYPIRNARGQRVAGMDGKLYTRELTGGITYRLPPILGGYFRPYARGGYAWTSYSLGSVTLNGTPLPDAALDGGYLPTLLPSSSWWPNTAYGGGGVELFTPPAYWLFKRLGYGVRVEVTGLAHRLDTDEACEDCHVTAERGDVAVTVILGW